MSGMLMLAPATLSIFAFVWIHRFCNRVGEQLKSMNLINDHFNTNG